MSEQREHIPDKREEEKKGSLEDDSPVLTLDEFIQYSEKKAKLKEELLGNSKSNTLTTMTLELAKKCRYDEGYIL